METVVAMVVDPFGSYRSCPDGSLDLDEVVSRLSESVHADLQRLKAAKAPWPALPAPLIPGDWALLRATACSTWADLVNILYHSKTARRTTSNRVDQELLNVAADFARSLTTAAEALHAAVPFYLPSGETSALASALPPDADVRSAVRLPYETCAVFFATPLVLQPDNRMWGVFDDEDVDELVDDIEMLTGGGEDVEALRDSLRQSRWSARCRRDQHIAGVVLQAGSGAVLEHVDDRVIWLVADTDEHGRPGDVEPFRGTLASSLLAPVVANLAAVLSWGQWDEPSPVDGLPSPGSRQWSRQVRTSHFRRLAATGAVDGVRTVRLPARRNVGERKEPRSGRTLSSHWRRGHWRRVRVGTKQVWRHELRWIPPVVVNSDLAGDMPARVYVLPDPDGM